MKNISLVIKSILVTSLFSLAFINSQSQQVVSIADEGTISDVSCASSVIITDSNINDGDYEANESYVITICIEAGSETNPQILISPELYGDVWDVDANSSLFVYDGPNTGAPLLGEFNSVNFPAGVNISGTGQCLTLEFISGIGSSGAGFTATFQCSQPLQDFTFELSGTPDIENFQDFSTEAMKICFGDSIIVTTTTSYPLSDAGGNGYEQTDATSLFRYSMGDGTIYQGLGLTEISHTYTDPFGYVVTVIITDVNGKVEFDQFYVLIAPRPNFSNLAVDDTLCIGAETLISGGIFEGDTIGIDPSTAAILGGGILGEQLYLPDGNDEDYETSINIDEFDDDQVIQSVSDFVNFCVNIEHSYLGDLEMMLTCPDGTSINIFNSYTGDGLFPGGFGGGGTFLGDAHDPAPDGVPGYGFDYCFNDGADWGTLGEEFALGNTVPVTSFGGGGNAMSPGAYQPEESFANFIGCPINGDWTLTIRDNLFSDDGFVFNWSIFFDPNINPSTVYYSPNIDSVYWADNADIIENQGTSILVQPSQEGNNSFTFVAIDEFGCIHDTVVNVYVRPEINLDDDIACDLTQILAPYDDLDQPVRDGVYAVIDRPTPTSDIIFEELSPSVDKATANEYGLYTILITSADCGYTDEAVIDFRPDPVVAPLISDTILCIGASIDLFAGPQEANSENFDILWISSNTGSFNTEDYLVTVDQTGTYFVVLSGVCGFDSDTTNVVAITLDFAEKAVCSLQAFASATLAPEGPGFWSAPENISFSNANLLNTQVSSSQYGIYPITYTDNRCPNDALTRDFNFVEQPEAVIIPENPDFCVDLDDFIVSATVSGSFNGTYTWTLNGETNNTQNDSLFYAHQPPGTDPRTFDPLESYTFGVTVQDAFSVCPLATGEMTFIADWCEYNIPNVVTPNSDNKNDRFKVEFMEFFPGAKLTVYDRWGKLVFERANFDQYQKTDGGWDPSDVNSGTYYYELQIPEETKIKIETGYIQVLKEK